MLVVDRLTVTSVAVLREEPCSVRKGQTNVKMEALMLDIRRCIICLSKCRPLLQKAPGGNAQWCAYYLLAHCHI